MAQHNRITPDLALPRLRDRHPLPKGEGRLLRCFGRPPFPSVEGAQPRGKMVTHSIDGRKETQPPIGHGCRHMLEIKM